jgi:hypothetical protein
MVVTSLKKVACAAIEEILGDHATEIAAEKREVVAGIVDRHRQNDRPGEQHDRGQPRAPSREQRQPAGRVRSASRGRSRRRAGPPFTNIARCGAK